MSPVDFYFMPESPPCRSVMMVANILNVDLKKHYLNLATGDHMKADYVKLNPLHCVPFIVDGDVKMTESRLIIAYLVDQYKPGHSLYPKDAATRRTVDWWLYFDIGRLYKTASDTFRAFLSGSKDMNRESEKSFREYLAYLDSQLSTSQHGYLVGENLTIADISIAASLTWPECCDYDFSEFKHLVKYLDKLKKDIPQYHEINDGPIENCRKWLASMQAKK